MNLAFLRSILVFFSCSRRSGSGAINSQSLVVFFSPLSIFFVRAPLSERLEQNIYTF